VRILQARFQVEPVSVRGPLVVGHIIWDDDEPGSPPVVRPTTAFQGTLCPPTLLAKLEHLLRITEPHSFE